MANAKKLKSGAWRTQAFKMINGKKVVKSFTVNPKDVDGVSLKARSQKAKMQSELMAREWQLSQNSAIMGDITVKQAIEGYIEENLKYYRLVQYAVISLFYRVLRIYGTFIYPT